MSHLDTAESLLQSWLDYYNSDRLSYPPTNLTRRFLDALEMGDCPVCGRSDVPHLHSQAQADWMRSG